MKYKSLFIALFTVLLSACSNSESPEAITKAFVKAVAAKNYDEAKKYCTKKSQQILSLMQMTAKFQDAEVISKEEVTCFVEGEKANCKFCCKEDEAAIEYTLVKEDGKWKVDFMSGFNNTMQNFKEGFENAKESLEGVGQVLDKAKEEFKDGMEKVEDGIEKVKIKIDSLVK